MDRKTAALILFCISLPLFLLLFSYQTTLFFTDLTAEQRAVFDFLQKEDKLQGYTEPELSHLEDVKRVMTFAEVVFYSLLLLTSLILTYYRREKHFFITISRNIFLQAFLIGSLFILVSYYLSYVYRHPRP